VRCSCYVNEGAQKHSLVKDRHVKNGLYIRVLDRVHERQRDESTDTAQFVRKREQVYALHLLLKVSEREHESQVELRMKQLT
jgi:hypothetical protein